MEYYVSRLFAGQDIRGADHTFNDLKHTWQISFIAGRAVIKDAAWFHKFVYYDPERGIGLGGRTAIIGVELNKLGEVARKPATLMSRQEKWAVYFGYYRDPERQSLLREIEGLEEGIGMAETVMNGFTQHELEMLREISEHRRQMDYQQEMIERKEALARFLAEERVKFLAEERVRFLAEERAKVRAEVQKQVFELLESGKTLEEAKRILGVETRG
jgi:hypothetical protein